MATSSFFTVCIYNVADNYTESSVKGTIEYSATYTRGKNETKPDELNVDGKLKQGDVTEYTDNGGKEEYVLYWLVTEVGEEKVNEQWNTISSQSRANGRPAGLRKRHSRP